MAFLHALTITAILALVSATVSVSKQQPNTGIKCECAAFFTDEIKKEDKPQLVFNPTNTTCDDAGSAQCKEICVNLVELGKSKAAEVLCEEVKHGVALQPSLFTRVCDKDFTYGGVTATQLICCHDGKTVPCVKDR